MPRPAPAPNPMHGMPTRARIMEAAASLFRAHGYEASMDAIAAAADVSKQTLYNQFGSKEDLFKAIISERSAAMRAPLDAGAAERAPRDVLLDLARGYLGLAFSPSSLGFLRTIVAASQRFPEIGEDFFCAGPQRTRDALADWMVREEKLGRLKTGAPQRAAEHFLSMLAGQVQMRGLLGLDAALTPEEAEERACFCVDAFMRAFAP